MSRLTIKEQIIGLIVTLLLLSAAIGGVGAVRISEIQHHTKEIAGNWLPSVTAINTVGSIISDYRITTLMHVLATADAEIAAHDRRLDGLRSQMETARRTYGALISSAEEAAVYRQWQEVWSRYESLVTEALDLSRRNANDAAKEAIELRVRPVSLEAMALLQRLQDLNERSAIAVAAAADGAATSAFVLIAILGAGSLAASILIGVVVIRALSRQMAAVAQPMVRLAQGDLSAEPPALPARTEMGAFARQLGVFKAALIAQRDADSRALRDAQEKAARAARLGELVAQFERTSADSIRGMAGAVTELDAMASSMTETARRGESQASGVAAAASEAAASVNTVASSAEELGASISEVARQISATAAVARRASQDARTTDAKVNTLSEAAQKIGDVVRLISGIAGQTNLLALNATIEAARAGEHGKGFAVVASEVKTLAAQTSQATDQIASQIATMQAETAQAVAAIRGIVETIEQVDNITVQVAAAAEEQAAATQEIIRAVVSASNGTQRVNGFADDLRQGATTTGAAATQVGASSRELSERAETLQKEVEHFLDGVRAA